MKSRITVIIMTAFLAVAMVSSAALAKGPPDDKGPDVEISVEFLCDEITVTSSKDISNVVVLYGDEEIKYDGLSGYKFNTTFSVKDDIAVKTVWVKSGPNFSGDGPGYGERFDSPLECDKEPEPEPTPTPEPEEPTPTPEPTPVPDPTGTPEPTEEPTPKETPAVEVPDEDPPVDTREPVDRDEPVETEELPATGMNSLLLVAFAMALVTGGTMLLRRFQTAKARNDTR